ncbi:MAG: IS66 family insertion sequence element accessory protein TnpB [Pontiella sp.]
MFHMNQILKVVLAVEPADLRKSFNGLYTIARNELGEIPEDGAMFIFSNRARTRIKVLCFDGTGCWVVREASGGRTVQLAEGNGSAKDVAQAGGAGLAARWSRSARCTNASVVSTMI